MIRFVVSVICVEPSTGREVILAKIESWTFDPDHAEGQIGVALDAARKAAKAAALEALQVWKPEVSISLVTENELVRPALHFGRQTLEQLYRARASVDFDPYV